MAAARKVSPGSTPKEGEPRMTPQSSHLKSQAVKREVDRRCRDHLYRLLRSQRLSNDLKLRLMEEVENILVRKSKS